MTFLQRNRLSTAGATSIPQLEARVMLAGNVDGTRVGGQDVQALTREETGAGFADDGFANISSVGDTGVAALNNAWNQEALRKTNGRLGSATSVANNRARITVTEAPNQGTDDAAPYGFPALLVGNSNGITSDENPFGTAGTPQDEIGSIPFTFVSNGGGDGRPKGEVYNSTLDIWFGQQKTNDGTDVPRGLVMLQNYNTDVVRTNGDGGGTGQPAGKLVDPGVTFKGLPGVYDVWFGENAGTAAEGGVPVNVTSYVRRDQENNGRQSTSGDLNVLIQDAVTRGNLDADLPLNSVYAGSEIWNGGEGLFNELELDLVRRGSSNRGRTNTGTQQARRPSGAQQAPRRSAGQQNTPSNNQANNSASNDNGRRTRKPRRG